MIHNKRKQQQQQKWCNSLTAAIQNFTDETPISSVSLPIKSFIIFHDNLNKKMLETDRSHVCTMCIWSNKFVEHY